MFLLPFFLSFFLSLFLIFFISPVVQHILAHVAVTAAAAAGIALTFDSASLFSWHPTLIFVWLVCSGNAVVLKARGVPNAHALHAILQMVALLALVGSLVVMYQVKESNKRPHWWTMSASWHAWAGAGLAIVFVLASVGAAAKMPIGCDGARIYENGANHKAWGRIVMVALCATVVSGWYKLHGDNPVNLYGMAAALLAFLALGGMLNPPALANLAGPRKAKSKQ